MRRSLIFIVVLVGLLGGCGGFRFVSATDSSSPGFWESPHWDGTTGGWADPSPYQPINPSPPPESDVFD